MSYDLIYNRLFLKTEKGLIFPLVLIGCNNVSEQALDGRWRRAREWSPAVWHSNNKKLLFQPDGYIQDVEESIEEELKRLNTTYSDPEHIKIHGEHEEWTPNSYHYCGLHINGKTCTYRQEQSYLINGAKNAEPVEEFIKRNGTFSINICKQIDYGKPSLASRIFRIAGSKELKEADDFYRYLMNDKRDGYCTVELIGISENYIKNLRKKEEKVLKEYPCFYLLEHDCFSYLQKKTARKIRLTRQETAARKFKTKKSAEKYLEDMIMPVNNNFHVKQIEKSILM